MFEEGIDYEGVRASLYEEFGITKSASTPLTNNAAEGALNATAKMPAKMSGKLALGTIALGTAVGGTMLHKLVTSQIAEKKKPLVSSMLSPETSLGAGVQTGALIGGSLLTAAAANSLARTRQSQQYV